MPRIAVLVPCQNEAATIGQVVAAFAAQLPTASIHVFDNNSSDATIERARAAGAQVREVALQGKGNVVRRLFADVDADVYVLVDGDATYDAAMAPALVERLLRDGLDMVVGARRGDAAAAIAPATGSATCC
ncbi:glycosyl transferase family protein [Xanthomonas translucens pv. poae]|uniref:Glycosyl transferase family protein n=1 Tax=Xanthomonas graminis pv. poae TaxID=227946 RepID=A0A0K2ZL52_9XANT|nr:glycosyl transferase family protein [Xanthomonas translucens pv. poae]